MTELVPLPLADPVGDLPPREPETGRVALGVRVANLTAIIVPFLGLVAVPFFLWGRGFYWTDLGLLLVMYALSVLGVTVGFHRLFTHRSFETHIVVKFVLAVLGSMAVEGPLLKWVATHRRHHQHSDTEEDPHSPYRRDSGFWGLLGGAWHAHIGWMFQPDADDLSRYVRDLHKNAALRITSTLFPLWVALGLVIPAAVGGFITGTWTGALTGLIWGGLVRIFLVHHVTWSINSACHLWGRRPYESDDQSRNNWVFGYLAMGEGWHNTHHAFPTSARHGLRWWQLDVSYWVIRTLAALHLAWNVRLPSKAVQAQKLRRS